MKPTVDITEVYADAVRITAEDLKPGDRVFDVYGGQYTITKVKLLKTQIRFVRSDGVTCWFERDQTITIIQAPPARPKRRRRKP